MNQFALTDNLMQPAEQTQINGAGVSTHGAGDVRTATQTEAADGAELSARRRGKIARLPAYIREMLNQRLEAGESGRELVAWLNGLPAVEEVLEEHFGGRPINEVNLSEWRQGGFVAWQKDAAEQDWLEGVAERAQGLAATGDGAGIMDRLATLLGVELTRLAERWLGQEMDEEERWKRLERMLKALDKLRRGDHRAARLGLARERWEVEEEQREAAEEKEELKKRKEQATAPIEAHMKLREMGQLYGGDESSYRLAAHELEVEHELPRGCLLKGWKPWEKNAAGPNGSKLNPEAGKIKPKGKKIKPGVGKN
jgi:hypothetical protein